jgi:hypothetical protein
MRTATCLTLLAVGAILTFAITGHPSFLNVQVAGLVVMATGVAGLLLPRRGHAWLHRRTVVRPDSASPVSRRRSTRYSQYQLSPGGRRAASNGSADHPADPPALTDARAERQAARQDLGGSKAAGSEVASPTVGSPEVASTEVTSTEVTGSEVGGSEVGGSEITSSEVVDEYLEG